MSDQAAKPLSQSVTLVCELLDDCLFSESGATDGGVQSLYYIPGSTLYGAAAARLYPELKSQDNQAALRALFHRGQVAFGDGHPLPTQQVAWPAPTTWQVNKGDAGTKQRLSTTLVNAAAHVPERGIQRKPLRDHWVTADGIFASIKTHSQLKTAFNPGRGTAAESQLFQYDSLLAGQRFCATLSRADTSEVSDALWSHLLKVFDDQVLHLGRSRSAQYGRVRINLAPAVEHPWPLSLDYAEGPQLRARLTLWCVSDLCLLDATLQPTVKPNAIALGLASGWHFLPEHSYVQTRRYSSFNSYRKAHDQERLVISRGSVLTYEWTDTRTPPEPLGVLRERLNAGLGLYQHVGLGHVLAQPAWAALPVITPADLNHHASLIMSAAPPSESLPALDEPENELLQWLKQRGSLGNADERAALWARDELVHVRAILRHAASLLGAQVIDVTPSRSQWGQVLQVCRNHATDWQALRAELTGNNGPLAGANVAGESDLRSRKKNSDWFHTAPYGKNIIQQRTSMPATTATSLGDWLVAALQDPSIASNPGVAMGKMASLCQRELTRQASPPAATSAPATTSATARSAP